MKPGFIKYIVALVLITGVFTACKITNPYSQPAGNKENNFRDQQTNDTTTLANLPVFEIFKDTLLQKLITRSIGENLDLKVAYTRINQFEAYYKQSRAAFYPTLIANVGVGASKLTEAQGFGSRTITQFQPGVSSTWEINVWGKLSSSRRAAHAALMQTQAGARAIQTTIIATIASNYYLLLALDQQLAITEQTVRNWDTTVTVMQALKQSAIVTQAAVVQTEAQRYAAEVTIPDLKQNIYETENALSILTGQSPRSIERSNLDIQEMPEALHTGVPAQLLANRPDVQEAEYAYRTAFEMTNMARASFYPSLFINASIVLSSLTLGSLFDAGAVAGSIAGGLTQPIFNRRLLRTNLAVAKAQQDAALFGFQNALLVAVQEVANAYSLHQRALEKVTVRTKQLSALEKSVDYTQQLLKNGFANYTEVITARQALLSAQLGKVNDRLQQLQATVDLYRALGGGVK